MKKFFILAALLPLLFTACGLDNYSAPDSGLSGRIIDNVTGENVEQDIIGGSVIYYVENGWENASTQKMVIKNDGTYCNSRMFSGNYSLYTSTDANFLPTETVEIDLKGQKTLDFAVQPYIRILNANIFRSGNIIRATFSVEQTTNDNCTSIALFAGNQQSVGYSLSEAGKIIMPIGVHYDQPQSFTIDMDIDDFPGLQSGKTYYFRIGALASAGGAKYNYAKAVKIKL